VSPKRIAELINERKSKCQATEAAFNKLKQAGADADLLEAVARGGTLITIASAPAAPTENSVAKKTPPPPNENPLKLELWTDKGRNAVYFEGEKIVINVRVNRDAFVRVYYTDASKQTLRIFPNANNRQARVRRGAILTVSNLQVTPPFGQESVSVLAVDKLPGDWNEKGSPAGPFLQVAGVPNEDRNAVQERINLTTRSKY